MVDMPQPLSSRRASRTSARDSQPGAAGAGEGAPGSSAAPLPRASPGGGGAGAPRASARGAPPPLPGGWRLSRQASGRVSGGGDQDGSAAWGAVEHQQQQHGSGAVSRRVSRTLSGEACCCFDEAGVRFGRCGLLLWLRVPCAAWHGGVAFAQGAAAVASADPPRARRAPRPPAARPGAGGARGHGGPRGDRRGRRAPPRGRGGQPSLERGGAGLRRPLGARDAGQRRVWVQRV